MKSKVRLRYMLTWVLLYAFAAGLVIYVLEVFSEKKEFAGNEVFGLSVTTFMVIAGTAAAVLSLIMIASDRAFYNITLIGIFAASSGIWCMCQSGAVRLVSSNIRAISLAEYISLYIMPIPLMWLASRFMKRTVPVIKLAFFTSMLVNAAMIFIVIVLYAGGIADITSAVSIFHILVAFDSVSLTVVSLFRWGRAEVPERFFETGIFSAAIISIIFLAFRYLSSKNEAPDFFYTIIVPLAVLFMTLMFFSGFIAGLFMRKTDNEQKQKLLSLAYTDEMTGFSNRTMGEEKLKELDASSDRYLLINMDLNFLKKVNDIAGHAAGDRYIRTFASIVRDVFSDADCICRMGGDEFLLMYSSSVPDEEALGKRFAIMKKMEAATSGFLPDGLSVDAAYGYAYSDYLEKPDSFFLYKFADRRMYQMKVFSKKGRRD